MIMKRIITALLALFCLASPAAAQFNAQSTYASSSGTSGPNAFTILLANVTQLSDLTAVPVCALMSAGNTGPSTLAVSGLAPVTIDKPSSGALVALVGSEIVAGQIYCFKYDGAVFELQSPVLNLGTVQAQSGFDVPINLQINCSAAANALTCSAKAANTGSDPTANNPIYIPFADGTTTAGDPVWKTITAAQSFTFAGGNTAGCVSGSPCRLWITEINDTTAITGTVRLGLSNQSSATQCFALNEAVLQSTGSGTTGGNSAGTIYTNAASLSGMAVRIVGYVEWTSLTTAGNWTAPNFVRLFGPGVKKPCDLVQRVYVQSGTYAATTNIYNPSATLPTPGGGLSVISQAITPTDAANTIRVSASAQVSSTSGGSAATAFIYDTTNSVVRSVAACSATAAGILATCSPVYQSIPGVTTSITYTIYATTENPNTFINGYNGTQFFGAVSNSFIQIEEYMGALEPANDNEPLRMFG